MDWEDWLYSLPKMGLHHGLKNINKLLVGLGEPQESLRAIHIAGTNGKGSTAAMLASILVETGLKAIGLYTSPHLDRITQRIQVNGKEISRVELGRLVKRINPIVGDCTFFEVMTAIAFLYFKEKEVEYAVLEVGLGGRLDATTAAKSKIGVITNIDFDHEHILGHTIEKIALEKSGIIKPGMTIITSEKKQAALEVIERVCKEKNARLVKVGPGDYKLSLKGFFQQENAACAVGAAKEIGISDFSGLEKTVWPGRMELKENVLMDVAHNPAGIKAMRKAVGQLDYKRLFIVFGVKKDKNATEMVKLLAPYEKIFLTKYKIAPNSLDPEKISAPSSAVVEDVGTAVEMAMAAAGEEDLILITGSTFTVSEARGAEKNLRS